MAFQAGPPSKMSEGSERKGINGRLRPRKPNTTYVHQLRNLRKSEQIRLEESGPSSPELQSTKIEDIFLPSPPSATKHIVEHGKQPYLCLFCDGQFPLRQSLCKHMQRVHQRTSRRENCIRCPFCGQKEANVDKLFLHLVEYHASQYFACLTCYVRFPSATDLCHHLQTICSPHKIQTALLPSDVESPSRVTANTSTKIHKKKKARRADSEAISVEKEPPHNLRSNSQSTGQDLVTAATSENEKSENSINLELDKTVIIILDDNPQSHDKPIDSANDNNDKEELLSGLGIARKTQSYLEVEQGNNEFQNASKCFDDDFYLKVATNVHENLTRYLDGTLTSLPSANSSEVELKECETVTVNSIDGFPTLLAVEQYAKGSEDLLQRRPILKHKWKTEASESDRHVEYDKQIDTLKNNGGHLPQCILPLISGLDIWTQIQMRKKHEDVSLNKLTDRSKKKNENIRKFKKSGKEKNLESATQEKSTTSEIDEFHYTKLTDLDSQNFSSLLGLQYTQSKYETTPALLSGEWARPRCYVCCACGNRSEDPRSLATHDSTHHPFTQSSHYEIVGKDLLDADILKHLYVPKSQMPKRLRPPRGTHTCTKCGKAVTADELHPHILECAGDTQVVRRKNRNRLFGVRKRRSRVVDEDALNRHRARKRVRRNKRDRLNRLSLQPRVRTEVGDAETIKKMLENLPAKRHHRESSILQNRSNSHKGRKSDSSTMHKKRKAALLDRNKRHAAAFKQDHGKIHPESGGTELKSTSDIPTVVDDPNIQLPNESVDKDEMSSDLLEVKPTEKWIESSQTKISSTDKISSETVSFEVGSTNVEINMESLSQQVKSEESKILVENSSLPSQSKDVIKSFGSSCHEGRCTTDTKISSESEELKVLSISNRLRENIDITTGNIREISPANKSFNVTTEIAENKEVDRGGTLEIDIDNLDKITPKQDNCSDRRNTDTLADISVYTHCNTPNKTSNNNNFETKFGDSNIITHPETASKNTKPPQLFKPYIDLLEKEPIKQCVELVNTISPNDTTMLKPKNTNVLKHPLIIRAEKTIPRPHKPKRGLNECIALLIQGKLSDATDSSPVFTVEQTAPMDLSIGKRNAPISQIPPILNASIAPTICAQEEALDFSTRPFYKEPKPLTSTRLEMTKLLSPQRKDTATFVSSTSHFKNSLDINPYTGNIATEQKIEENISNTSLPKAPTREMATNTMLEAERSISSNKNVTIHEFVPIILPSSAAEHSRTKNVEKRGHLQPVQDGGQFFKSASSEDNIKSDINMSDRKEKITFSLCEPPLSQKIIWNPPISTVSRENGTASLRAVRIKSASDKPRIVATSNKTSTTGMSPEKQNGINYITEKLKDVDTPENCDQPNNNSSEPSSVEQTITKDSNEEVSQNNTIAHQELPKEDIKAAQADKCSDMVTKSTIENVDMDNESCDVGKVNDSQFLAEVKNNDMNSHDVIKSVEICESTDEIETEKIISNITANEQEIAGVESPSLTLPDKDDNKYGTDSEMTADSLTAENIDNINVSVNPREIGQIVLYNTSPVFKPDTAAEEAVEAAQTAPLSDDHTLTSSKLNDITATSENIQQHESNTETPSKSEPIVVQDSEETSLIRKDSVLVAINIDNLRVNLDTSEKENENDGDTPTCRTNQSSQDLSTEMQKPDNSFKLICNGNDGGEISLISKHDIEERPDSEVISSSDIKVADATKHRTPKKDKYKIKSVQKNKKKTLPSLRLHGKSKKDLPVLSLPNLQNDAEKFPICSDSDDNLPLSSMIGEKLQIKNKFKCLKSVIRNVRKTRNKVEKLESRSQVKIKNRKNKSTKLKSECTLVNRSTITPIVNVETGYKDDHTEEINQNNNGIAIIPLKSYELTTENDNSPNGVQNYDQKQKFEEPSVIIEEIENACLPTEVQPDEQEVINPAHPTINIVTPFSTNDECIATIQSIDTESLCAKSDVDISTTQKRKIDVSSPAVMKKKPRRRRQNIFREPKRYKKKPKASISSQDTDLYPEKKVNTSVSKESEIMNEPRTFTPVSDENSQQTKIEANLIVSRQTRAVKRRKYITKDKKSSSESRSTSQDTVQSDSQSQDSLYSVKKNLDEYRIGSEPHKPNRRFTRAQNGSTDFLKVQDESDLKADDEDSTPQISDLNLSLCITGSTRSEIVAQCERQEKNTLPCLLPEHISEASTDSSTTFIKKPTRSSAMSEAESQEGTLEDNTESEEESVTLSQLAEVKAGKLKTDLLLQNITQKSTDDSDSSSEPDFTKYVSRKIQAKQRNSPSTKNKSGPSSIIQAGLGKVLTSDKEKTFSNVDRLHTETHDKVEFHRSDNNAEEFVQLSKSQNLNRSDSTEPKTDLPEKNSTENIDGKQIDTYFENFGFFGQRQPRKSNLLASKKIHETFKANAEDESTQSNSTDAESIKYKRKRGALQNRKSARSKNTRGSNRVGNNTSRVSKDKIETLASLSDSESSTSMPLMAPKRAKRVSLIPDDHKQITAPENTKINDDTLDENPPSSSIARPNDNGTAPVSSQNLSSTAPANSETQPMELGARQIIESKKIIKVGGKELTCDEAFFYEVCGLLRNAEGKQAVRLVCGNIVTLDRSDPKNIVISFDPPSDNLQTDDSNIAISTDFIGSESNHDMSAEDLERTVIKTLMRNRALKDSMDGEPALVEKKQESKADNAPLPYILEDKFDIIKRKSSARSASAVATVRAKSSSSGSRTSGNSAVRSASRPTSTSGSRTSANSSARNSTGSNQRARARTPNVTSTPADVLTLPAEAVINKSYRKQSVSQNISEPPEIVPEAIERDPVKTIIDDILNQPTLIDDIAKVPTKTARRGLKKGQPKCPFISRTHKHSLCKQRLRLFFAHRRKLAADSSPGKGMQSAATSRSTTDPYDVYDFSDSEDVEEFDCITMAQINKLFDALNRTGADNNYYTEETDSDEDFIYTPGHVFNKKRYGAMSTGSLRPSYPEKSAVVGKIFKNVARDSRNDKIILDNDKEGKRKAGKKDVKTLGYQGNGEKNKEEIDQNKNMDEKSTLDELFDSLLVTTPMVDSVDLVDKSQSIKEHNANQSSDYSDSNLAPVEPEAGVARQRTRRKCAVGKQNVLAETWSSESDEEKPYSNYHSTRRKKPNRQPVAPVATPLSVRPPEPSQSQHLRDLVEASTSSSTNPTLRRECGMFRPAYSLSSSEDEEPQPLVQQHGWIVGNSHKKLVTMLAHAKGRKKEANKKGADKDEYEFND